jgi:3-hydroxybutyryl-CoA dehydrogenase
VSERTVGVVGAGTMGSGIAQLAAQAGYETLVFDPVEGAAAGGVDRALGGIDKLRAKGKLKGEPAALRAVGALDELAACRLIVEAAPERLELKHELFASLSEVAPEAVLASNTSSIPITAIAQGAADPSRVIGMHFFNPAPLMKLMELIAGMESSPEALALGREVGEAMGKRVIDAADVAGFLVNRCNRPFGLEALRVLQERMAEVPTIDRILRGNGFRMGPFELQDLVGIDVGFEVSKSFYELSFGEPRWRPSPLSAQMVAAGRHGRKSGRGWYRYPREGIGDEPAPEPGGGDGLIVIAGDLAVADDLRDLAGQAGWDVAEPEDANGAVPHLILDCGHHGDPPLEGGPQALLLVEGSLHALDPGGSAIGFHVMPPIGDVVEFIARAQTDTARFEAFVRTLGLIPIRVAGDAPGLVSGRMLCQVINESGFAVGEGIGSPDDVDAGLVLGMNHPQGPFERLEAAGLDHVLLVLDALQDELGEERYRAAPFLRRLAAG